MKNKLVAASPIQPPFTNCKHINKLGKGIWKRKQINGGRPGLVATRLTAEQLAKLDALVTTTVEKTGIQASRSSVLADLIDNAFW